MTAPRLHPSQIFRQYLPEAAVGYCFGLWKQYDFHFQIKKKRQTKLGDYRYDPRDKSHTITVNADLNPFAFLITYLHEVAHLVAQINHPRAKEPHGQEWKDAFCTVATPMLNKDVFPEDILLALHRYFKNPKATSCGDSNLMRVLHMYNANDDRISLADIKPGNTFEFSGRLFSKELTQRTRVLCKELSTGRKYLISKAAFVHVPETN